MKFDFEEKAVSRYIISLLLSQANADDDFSNLEKKYLVYAAESLKLTNEDVAQIRLQPEKYLIAPPAGEQHRMKILYYLLFMMKADNVVTEAEEKLSHLVGLKLGFRADMIDVLIMHMKKYLHEDLPPNSMVEKTKIYLN